MRTAETSDGCTLDLALISELFANCMEAARTLGIDRDFAANLKTARERLIPYQIGKFGQLQEWSKDFEERTPGQRHMSHMYPLFPGSEFTARRNREFLAGSACLRSNAASPWWGVYAGLEPVLGYQLLGAAAGWREGI